MFKQIKLLSNQVGPFKRSYTTATTKNVWVVTDGGLENTLQAMTLGKQLAGSNQLSKTFQLKTIVASKKLQVFPAILQKYLVDWSVSRNKGNSTKLPWYLSSLDSKESNSDDSNPDYIISSGQDAIPACLHLSKLYKKCFSVYVGYPGIPFVNFDQVILPKYEANAKMAALGPLARQKNGIITPAPLLDTTTTPITDLFKEIIPASFKEHGYSTVIIGGHSPNCRWYSEDAITLADNIKRIANDLGEKIVIVFTDRTPEMVKEKLSSKINSTVMSNICIWDTTKASIEDKINTYENIIQYTHRAIFTADLDYACAHALAKQKPVYITFSGRARSYLAHFHRWLLDSHLTRKLRLDRRKLQRAKDPYSYLGEHVTWGNAIQVFQLKNTMAFVKKELEEIREEKVTGKRRK